MMTSTTACGFVGDCTTRCGMHTLCHGKSTQRPVLFRPVVICLLCHFAHGQLHSLSPRQSGRRQGLSPTSLADVFSWSFSLLFSDGPVLAVCTASFRGGGPLASRRHGPSHLSWWWCEVHLNAPAVGSLFLPCGTRSCQVTFNMR